MRGWEEWEELADSSRRKGKGKGQVSKIVDDQARPQLSNPKQGAVSLRGGLPAFSNDEGQMGNSFMHLYWLPPNDTIGMDGSTGAYFEIPVTVSCTALHCTALHCAARIHFKDDACWRQKSATQAVMTLWS
jgi:hypothetical protein